MKTPSWKTPLILSAVLFGLGGFAYWLQYDHKPKSDQAAAELKKPLSLPESQPGKEPQIAMFKIKSTRGLIEVKCDDQANQNCLGTTRGSWSVSYPEVFKADPDTVKEVLGGMLTATATETVDLASETPEKRKQILDDYGLSENKRTSMNTQFFEVVLENGKRITAWFGQEHPLGDKVFVGHSEDGVLNENKIFLLSNFHKSSFDQTLNKFKVKDVFSFDRTQIESFQAKLPEGSITAEKKNGLWNIKTARGFSGAGDYEHIETILASILKMKAKDFPESSVLKGLKPVVSYQLKTANSTHSFELFEKLDPDHGGNHLYAKTSARPELLELDRNFRTSVDQKLTYFRNTVLFSDSEKVTTTRVQISGTQYPKPVEFSYLQGKWLQKETGAEKMDPTTVAKLLDLLSVARVQDYVSGSLNSKDRLRITLGDDKSAERFRYEFSIDQNVLYAKNLNQNLAEKLKLEEALKNALPFDAGSWKLQK